MCPYIPKEAREKFNNFRLMASHLDIASKGELEYLVYVLMLEYMSKREKRYSSLHDCTYAVHHVADEFRRRYLDKREDKARQVNGDIIASEKTKKE